MKTVVGLYNTVADANKVKETLRTEGYDASHITVIDQSEGATGGSTAGNATSTGQTTMEKVKGFFTSFSDHEDAHEHYAARVESGGALLAVTVPDEEAEETADMLYEHGATGIQGDYKGNSTAGAEDVAVLESSKDQYSATGNTIAASGEQVIPVVEESLVVGKRQVDRGGVRIYSHVVEKPVSADVTLHDERIVLDRRPVDRSATEADFSTGTGAIELTDKVE